MGIDVSRGQHARPLPGNRRPVKRGTHNATTVASHRLINKLLCLVTGWWRCGKLALLSSGAIGRCRVYRNNMALHGH